MWPPKQEKAPAWPGDYPRKWEGGGGPAYLIWRVIRRGGAGAHGVVHQGADRGLRRARLKVRPARFLRYPEDAGGAVFVWVFGVGALLALGVQLGVLGLEGVGDVLQEDQAEDDVFVLGRVHVVAQGVGGGPELGFEAQGGPVRARGRLLARWGHRCAPPPCLLSRDQTTSTAGSTPARQGPRRRRGGVDAAVTVPALAELVNSLFGPYAPRAPPSVRSPRGRP